MKPGRVRIIAGQYRRTPIAVVAAPGLRPTPDRVRATVFNWLEHRLGPLAQVDALDLFAGSGALGFEMASRGARQVVLVDSNARAVAGLRELQRRLGAAAVSIQHADWQAAAARMAPASFDVIFLDPPFDAGVLAPALAAAARLVRPRGLVYVESASPLPAAADGTIDVAGLRLERTGRAGLVHFHLLRARAS